MGAIKQLYQKLNRAVKYFGKAKSDILMAASLYP